MLLTVIALPVSDHKEAEDAAQETAASGEESNLTGADKTTLERRLEEFLSRVDGVGEVQVLLMTEEESTGFYSSGNTTVTGVLVAAQGADRPVIVQKIKEAVMALFQLEAHKIKIMKMN
jgi:stage III sporulation protein AG